ncbi:RCC1/BLIP-II protein [Hesseltinella vesiculosa]|uniref:RCC1/BLIP-II protein n=1 Tax=Hesseltinella vesiculosa TaxID=101127 RepID=A0A1X2GWR2_9FUNG|nr:RCC1/BLIP-II protein [Hesseltinella vesiculosa]
MSTSTVRRALFGWGHSHFLPLNRSATNLLQPVLLNHEPDYALPATEAITCMAAGWGHSLLSTKENVYGFGLNHGNQLGQVNKDHIVMMLKDHTQVKHLGCGREHSHIVLHQQGRDHLYSMGNNMYGQLGLSESKASRPGTFVTQSKPTQVTIQESSITNLVCGLDNTIFSTDTATFGMGWGADGQLGQGDEKAMDQATPHRVALEGRVKKLSSSTDFTLALMDDGALWVWGNSEYGQGMQGRKIDRILSPTPVTTMGRVVDIAAGGPFSIVLTDDGKVYSCGYGSLGRGSDTLESLALGQVNGLDNRKITGVFAATDYAAALSDSGDLFTWGLNGSSGRLGLGHVDHAFTAVRLEFHGWQVESLVLGTNHAMALCVE